MIDSPAPANANSEPFASISHEPDGKSTTQPEIAAESDSTMERPLLGALVCLRAILEAFPDHGFAVHPADVNEWRDKFDAWFKKNQGRMRKLKAAERNMLLKNIHSEFDRVLTRAISKGYRLDQS